MNKKGADDTPMGFIVGIVLVVIVAGFAIYWFYSSGKTIFDKKDILVEDLSFTAQVCDAAAQNPDLALAKTNYCVAPKKMTVAGRQGYFNCQYIKDSLGAIIPSGDKITCESKYIGDNWAKYYCGLLKENQAKDYTSAWVNGKKCSDLDLSSVVTPGVSAKGTCTGNVKQCGELSGTECVKQYNCQLSLDGNACINLALECSSFKDNSDRCKTQKGCTWTASA